MIGARLRMLRKEKGITQSELAKALSVSKYSISAYENGHSEPDDATKVRMARLLNVSLDYLLGAVDQPFSLDGHVDSVTLPPGLDEQSCRLVIDFLQFLAKRSQ